MPGNFKENQMVAYVFRGGDVKYVDYGKIDAITDLDGIYKYFVEIKTGFFLVLDEDCLSGIPKGNVRVAEASIKGFVNAAFLLTIARGTPLLVTSLAAEGLGGAAATTYGLSTLGMGAGMLGGIVVLATAPAALGVVSLNSLTKSLTNDGVTQDITRIAGVTGAVLGVGTTIALVSIGGPVGGLTSAGITSGLAFLGGGSIASGGGGMLVGMFVASLIPLAGVALIGGVAYIIVDNRRQEVLMNEFNEKMGAWKAEGCIMPDDTKTERLLKEKSKRRELAMGKVICSKTGRKLNHTEAYHVAICGSSGEGKSTMINALRGIKDTKDSSYAPVNETEETSDFNCYSFEDPRMQGLNKFILWDLPGAGTEQHKSESYFDEKHLILFDLVIFVYHAREVQVMKTCLEKLHEYQVPFVIARTKADQDIQNKMMRSKLTRDEVVQLFREDMHSKLEQNIGTFVRDYPTFLVSMNDLLYEKAPSLDEQALKGSLIQAALRRFS